MKHCIVQDSSFIVAAMDIGDPFHRDAVFLFKEVNKRKDSIKIIVPPLGLYEIIVILTKKGIPHNEIEQKIMRLIHLDQVIVTSITEASAFKHCKRLLTLASEEDFLRTQDFLITSLAMDYEAQILTFDKKMWKKTKKLYDMIYYCSALGNMNDETEEFLNDLEQILEPR